MQTWLNYFQYNRANRAIVPWERGIRVEPHLYKPLVASLRKFQLGESGDGVCLRRHVAGTGDAAYCAAIDLFIKEEQEHARLMAEILKRLDEPLLENHWTDKCFMVMRHFFGLHQELMVLLLPEMIAKRYFRALRDGTNDEVLQTVFGQILQDEEGHLAFHVEYLRQAFKGMSFLDRISAQLIWRFVYRVTCIAVMFDHGSVLKSAGVDLKEFWRSCGEIFDEVAAGIFSPAHVLAPTKLAVIPNP